MINQNNSTKLKFIILIKSIFTQELKITKQQSNKIFLILSILLIADFLILPIISEIIKPTNDRCDYGLFSCIALSLLPLIIFGSFWCAAWNGVYSIFFMTEEEKIKKRNSKFFLIRLKMKNIDYVESLHKSQFRKSSILVTAILCFGIGYLFLFELCQIAKLIF